MEDQSHNFAAHESAQIRSFTVEAFVGHRVTGWPFARFDISSSELRVRLSFPWFTTRSQQATAIRAVIVTRRFGDIYWIGFDDANGALVTCTSIRFTVVSRSSTSCADAATTWSATRTREHEHLAGTGDVARPPRLRASTPAVDRYL